MKRKACRIRKKSSKNKFTRGEKRANLFKLKEEEKNPFKDPINDNNKKKTSKRRKYIFQKPKKNSQRFLFFSFIFYIIFFVYYKFYSSLSFVVIIIWRFTNITWIFKIVFALQFFILIMKSDILSL